MNSQNYITYLHAIHCIVNISDRMGFACEIMANLCFGGPDYRTIYVTARTGLYSIGVSVAGNAVFGG